MKTRLLRVLTLTGLLAFLRLPVTAHTAAPNIPADEATSAAGLSGKAKAMVKAPKNTPPPTAEAATVNAIVEKHRQQEASAREARRAQTQARLRTELPTDSAGRKKWREQVRAAMAAERNAAEEADKALRAELEKADDQRHPESKGEP